MQPGRGRVFDSIVDAIGSTPIVRLRRLPQAGGVNATILANDIAAKRVPRRMASYDSAKLPGDEAVVKKIFAGARYQAKRVKHLMPHPWLCLDAVEAGVSKGSEVGLAAEQDVFGKAVTSKACKGLVHMFFASRSTAAVPGVTDVGLKPRATKCVAVVGGGLMGSGIATACGEFLFTFMWAIY